MRNIVYAIQSPQHMVFDLDSTLLQTYGAQEGEAFNYHYQAHGYHPLLCFDGKMGGLLKAELWDGTHYCSKELYVNNLWFLRRILSFDACSKNEKTAD